ncbi:MAG: hypothetical protein BMS9Abin10_0121 [Gammaproteobacteria bacterium]|nr:MAG: hypothetical protein BMS9Abin10_0121 [Gammaproteobacteria bacterium]
MNRIVGSTIVVLTLILWMPAANAQSAVYALEVDGLACPFCAYGIEKKLSAIKGVEKIDVDIKSGQVVVTMASGASLNEERARRAVKDAGFTLRAFSPSEEGKQE